MPICHFKLTQRNPVWMHSGKHVYHYEIRNKTILGQSVAREQVASLVTTLRSVKTFT